MFKFANMILPILAYGHPNLRKVSEDISPDYPELEKLIENMWETMYFSSGVGLAAPQINKQIRLIVIDANPFSEDYPEAKDFKKVFINPYIIESEGEPWTFTEGCLSVPDIHEDVERPAKVLLEYEDEDFNPHSEWFDGVLARIIMHEYDHLEGVLFVDRIHPLRKVMNKRKLFDISRGNINTSYKMIFSNKK